MIQRPSGRDRRARFADPRETVSPRKTCHRLPHRFVRPVAGIQKATASLTQFGRWSDAFLEEGVIRLCQNRGKTSSKSRENAAKSLSKPANYCHNLPLFVRCDRGSTPGIWIEASGRGCQHFCSPDEAMQSDLRPPPPMFEPPALLLNSLWLKREIECA